MKLRVRSDGHGTLRWSLVAPQAPTEPIADGLRSYADVSACQRAAADLLAASPACMMAVQQPDGRWRWSVAGPDGVALAQSSCSFDTAAACGYALHDLRSRLFVSQPRPVVAQP
jgi:hypothetical protein